MIVGSSRDMADDPMIYRRGLRKALKAIRTGKAHALMVTRLENISHSNRRLLYVLKRLQNSGAVLICGGCDIRYALAERGLERPLRRRAARKGLGFPWCC